MKIRRMKQEDIGWVSRLGHRTIELFGFFNKEEMSAIIGSRKWKCFVAEDHVGVGFIIVELEPELRCACVWDIAIKPEFRGEGTGRMLLKHAMMSIKRLGMDYFYLFVNSRSRRAIRFYKTLGFKGGANFKYMST